MAILYNKQMFIERVKKHLADGFPHTSFAVTDNEILLYIDASIPFVLKGQMFENAKVTGVIDVPEAYLVTYNITPLLQDAVTLEWYADLPQTPLALPDGYNITDANFKYSGGGRTQSIFMIKTKRKSYRDNLPKPAGIFGRVEGRRIFLEGTEAQFLYGEDFYVQMPISRTSSKTDIMNLPDDAIEPIFNSVVKTILQRYQIPQDIIKDDLPAGNKSS